MLRECRARRSVPSPRGQPPRRSLSPPRALSLPALWSEFLRDYGVGGAGGPA